MTAQPRELVLLSRAQRALEQPQTQRELHRCLPCNKSSIGTEQLGRFMVTRKLASLTATRAIGLAFDIAENESTNRSTIRARALPRLLRSVNRTSVPNKTEEFTMTPTEETLTDYDLGFVRLFTDGSITVHFRVTWLQITTETHLITANLKDGTVDGSELPSSTKPFDGVRVMDAWYRCEVFLKTGLCPTLSTKFRSTSAGNSNSSVRVLRHNGVSMLDVCRSRRSRYFIHDGENWMECEDPRYQIGVWKYLLAKRSSLPRKAPQPRWMKLILARLCRVLPPVWQPKWADS